MIGWVPTARALVVSVATPEPFKVPVPRLVAPSRKVTVPVGVPVPGATAVTVAVKVTGLARDARVRRCSPAPWWWRPRFTTWLRAAEVEAA